ncbi:hypothetical protein CPA46_08220 [Sphingopyxis terrae subsp. ummariensis]|nr:hypothetical protein CPA46_08220 [Sphingopyxis terrae subsp. ummariensis]
MASAHFSGIGSSPIAGKMQIGSRDFSLRGMPGGGIDERTYSDFGLPAISFAEGSWHARRMRPPCLLIGPAPSKNFGATDA